jgi:hypothetical protein
LERSRSRTIPKLEDSNNIRVGSAPKNLWNRITLDRMGAPAQRHLPERVRLSSGDRRCRPTPELALSSNTTLLVASEVLLAKVRVSPSLPMLPPSPMNFLQRAPLDSAPPPPDLPPPPPNPPHPPLDLTPPPPLEAICPGQPPDPHQIKRANEARCCSSSHPTLVHQIFGFVYCYRPLIPFVSQHGKRTLLLLPHLTGHVSCPVPWLHSLGCSFLASNLGTFRLVPSPAAVAE